MKVSVPAMALKVVMVGLVLGLGALSPAEAARKGPAPATGIVSGWVPNNGVICYDDSLVCTPGNEKALGDLWTFNCPAGAQAVVRVDTKDDLDGGQSCLDPVVHVYDGQGTLLASGDDEMVCSYPQICGARCPAVFTPCGTGRTHSVVVRDFGDNGCNKGGGYKLEVEVWLDQAQTGCVGLACRLKPEDLKLGGGPFRSEPRWLRGDFPGRGPALDDEGVPSVPLAK